ncbi:MAG: hypothetical protein ACRC1H_20860, partial [Caldilineaceae bacterium]
MDLHVAWQLPADAGDIGCPVVWHKPQSVTNIAWVGEDINRFQSSGLAHYSSGTRAEELRGVSDNRLEVVARGGRTATVFALENTAQVKNELLSPPML